MALDLSTVIGMGTLASWYFIVEPALESSDVTATQMILGVSLPVQDLITACAALLVLMRGVTAGRKVLGI